MLRTPEEVEILGFAMVEVLQKLDTPEEKFIICFTELLGFSKFECALALGIHPSTLSGKISKIKEKLSV